MSTKHDEWLVAAEQSIRDYLKEHGDPISIQDLVVKINEVNRVAQRLRSVEVKIAALALVNKGDAEINRSWELSLSRQGREHDERQPVACAAG